MAFYERGESNVGVPKRRRENERSMDFQVCGISEFRGSRAGATDGPDSHVAPKAA